jgi:hypothetical protein
MLSLPGFHEERAGYIIKLDRSRNPYVSTGKKK